MSDRGLNGNNNAAYKGVRASTPPQLVINLRAPTVTDYLEFCVGDLWINDAGRLLTPQVFPGPGDVYMLTSVARNVATWIPMVGGLMSLDGDLGLPVFGDINQNIRLHSDIPNLDTTSNPAGHQVIFSSAGGGAFAEGFITDDANVVVPNNAGRVFVSGADGVNTTGAGNQITIHGVVSTFPTDNGIATPVAGVMNINSNLAALGCGSTVSFSAPGPANTVQLNVSDASNHTIIGNGAGSAGMTGVGNTVLGVGSGQSFTGANGNCLIGHDCAPALTTGGFNCIMGRFSATNATDTFRNVIIGNEAAIQLTTGKDNCIIGNQAAQGITTGQENIIIGVESAIEFLGNESFNIIIGSHVGRLGDTGVCKIDLIRGVTTNEADAIAVLIDSEGQLGTVSSSIRYKDNVEDMGSSSDNVLNLRPVTFEYKKHPGVRQFGLIAEEVAGHMPRLVVYDSDGLPETVKYHELPAILLNEMQKLVKRIDQLEKNLQRYEGL